MNGRRCWRAVRGAAAPVRGERGVAGGRHGMHAQEDASEDALRATRFPETYHLAEGKVTSEQRGRRRRRREWPRPARSHVVQ